MKLMSKSVITALGLACVLSSTSVLAVQKDILVTAAVDPSLLVTLADGSDLPSTVDLKYKPGNGLEAYKEQIKFWSNAVDKDLKVRLVAAPSLTDETGKNSIPLAVSLNGNVLSVTETSLPYNTTFPTGIANGSAAMPFSIYQSNTTEPVAGNYSGTVSLIVTQSTTTSGA